MDGWSSLPLFQSGGSELLQQEQDDLPISSQVQEQLKQIYLLMDMEEEHGHAEAPSSQSSTFHSFSASLDEASSSLMRPGSSNGTNNSCHINTPEVTSLNIPLSPATYYYGDLGMIPNLEEFTHQETHHEHRVMKHKNGGHGGAGAFMPYSRHLSTKKKPNKPGSGGGQRAIKAAMSALARMHMVRLAQWQCYQMEMAVAPPTTTVSNCNQVQHVLSERKRREKLNDSFNALKAVLPSAPKKDKASILIIARDYVNTLKSRVAELEERNRMLVELQHHCNNGDDPDDVSDEKIEVNIDRAAVVEETSQEYFRVRLGTRKNIVASKKHCSSRCEACVCESDE